MVAATIIPPAEKLYTTDQLGMMLGRIVSSKKDDRYAYLVVKDEDGQVYIAPLVGSDAGRAFVPADSVKWVDHGDLRVTL